VKVADRGAHVARRLETDALADVEVRESARVRVVVGLDGRPAADPVGGRGEVGFEDIEGHLCVVDLEDVVRVVVVAKARVGRGTGRGHVVGRGVPGDLLAVRAPGAVRGRRAQVRLRRDAV